MAGMTVLLEKDKERFLQRVASLKEASAVMKEASDQLGRMLYAFNEEESREFLQQCAYGLVQVAKASVGFLDCFEDARVWKTSTEKREKGKSWIPLAIVAAALCVAGLLLARGIGLMTLALVAGGCILAFAAGVRFMAVPKGAQETRTEVNLSGQRVYRCLYGMAVAMDSVLDELQAQAMMEKRRRLDAKDGLMDTGLVEMFASLLDEIYAMDTSESKDAMLSAIRYYLHKGNVELLEYSKDEARKFDVLPGKGETMRPAIVQEGKLLKKGLASGGR